MTYFVIKNINGRFLKNRTGSNGTKRAWVKTIKAATVFAEGQANAAVEDLKKSPYYDGLTIEPIGESHSAWAAKLDNMKKYAVVRVPDYNGGYEHEFMTIEEANCLVEKNAFHYIEWEGYAKDIDDTIFVNHYEPFHGDSVDVNVTLSELAFKAGIV